MTLDHNDNPPPGIVTRRAARTAASLVDFSLDSCALLLKDECPDTPEALREQRLTLREELHILRKTVFRLENSEPDAIIEKGYLLKKSDMTDQLTQRMAEINATLTIFNQDKISIINTTFDSSNQDQSSLINDTITSPSSPKRPTANHTASSIAGSRPENLIQRSHEPPLGGTQPKSANPTHRKIPFYYLIHIPIHYNIVHQHIRYRR